jgi:hypothetical protein
MPEVGLEPTRPCGQRIVSAPKDRSRVTVGWRLAVFLGNDVWRSILNLHVGAHSPHSVANTFPAPARPIGTVSRCADTTTVFMAGFFGESQ